MVVTYLGHSSGVSKKDNKGFKILYYSYSDGRTVGQACDKAFIYDDSDLCIPPGVQPNEALLLEFNQRGFLSGIFNP